MLELKCGDVHLWITFSNSIQDPKLLDTYKQLLTAAEFEQQQKYYFAKDKHQYLITRALIRFVLSRYSTTSPKNWRFTKNKYGRPEIVSEDTYDRSLSFNVSHTKGLILLGITRQIALGVDTESQYNKKAPLDLISCFSELESNAISFMPKRLQNQRFFHYWTLKESYIKARGMGLSLPLDQVSFDLSEQNQIYVSFDSRMDDSSDYWYFWLLQLSKEHVGAICVQRKPGIPYRLIIKKSVPLESEVFFPCSILRQSG